VLVRWLAQQPHPADPNYRSAVPAAAVQQVAAKADQSSAVLGMDVETETESAAGVDVDVAA
jgi:hypothetical protein